MIDTDRLPMENPATLTYTLIAYDASEVPCPGSNGDIPGIDIAEARIDFDWDVITPSDLGRIMRLPEVEGFLRNVGYGFNGVYANIIRGVPSEIIRGRFETFTVSVPPEDTT